MPLSLALSPRGAPYLINADDADPLEASLALRIETAFARSHAHGLLHLGAVETASHLPPIFAFFADFARGFMTRLCAVPDLEAIRENVEIPPDADTIGGFAVSAPPMTGAEYLSSDVLIDLWSAMEGAVRAEIIEHEGSTASYLAGKSSLWSTVGRVHFHLAENKNDPQAPFAFLATYTTRVSEKAKVQHRPLGKALGDRASAGDRSALLALLLPVQKAAEESPLIKRMVDSGEIFHPLAWTPEEAHAFLKDVPLLESSGVVVRVPNWWSAGKPPRARVQVSVGAKAPSQFGVTAMLDFAVDVTLDGETLTDDERRKILSSTSGLTLVKGTWVEVDRDKLAEVLAHWKTAKAAAKDGISYFEAMRLLSGTRLAGDDIPEASKDAASWSTVMAGEWMASALEGLRAEGARGAIELGSALRATLRGYQKVGVEWLWLLQKLGLGGCLADDMGLGKTIQVLSLMLLLKQRGETRNHLLVVPASLIANWKSEAARFCPSLEVLVAHPSAMQKTELANPSSATLKNADVVITTYGALHRIPWLLEREWGLVVLDEAQAIKNPGAKQTRAAKALKSRTRLALTGTPIENRLGDLWSLFDFICPGLLGSAKEFGAMSKRLAKREHNAYAPLRSLVRPYILRRLKTDKSVVPDLPDKTEVHAHCSLTKTQAALYQQAVGALRDKLNDTEGIGRKGAILASLLRFKQICNHPSQWLGDGSYEPDASGKFGRLRELAESVASRQEKLLVFTQFQEMTAPLATFLATIFGRDGLVLHGGTPLKQRQKRVDDFQRDDGPPFFVLSLKAGGTGLNLTAASHVIHFDRWWNPAVERQASDRAYRIGQKKNVLVHKFVCRGTIEEKIDALLESKVELSDGILLPAPSGASEVLLTEMSDRELLSLVSLDITTALEEPE